MANEAIVRLPNGLDASFDGDAWKCSNATIARMLNTTYTVKALSQKETFAYHPDLTVEMVEWAARELKGTIIALPDSEFDEGAVY